VAHIGGPDIKENDYEEDPEGREEEAEE